MIERYVKAKIELAFKDTPVVIVIGPRQCGKTTLVNQIKSSIFNTHSDHSWAFVTLDDSAQLTFAKSDPIGFIRSFTERHIIIDEIQRVPDLFMAIKQSVDENRLPGRFLLTGSANAMLLPKLSDSLAGRIEVIELYPLSYSENASRNSDFFDKVFNGEVPKCKDFRIRAKLIDEILMGGFPEPRSRELPNRRLAWFNQYLKALLNKDLKDLGQVEYTEDMPKLIQAMSAQVA